jgi:GNAT superfamily N-acetyltransferase
MTNTVSSPLRIDPATPADVPLLMSMIRALADFEKIADQLKTSESRLRDDLFGDKPYADVLIARSGDAPAGYALYCSKYSSFVGPGLYLDDIFVLPEFRGQGVGKAMFREVARVARERGMSRLEWSVLEWNENAIGFYKRIGADVLPDWRTCRLSREAINQLADSM